MKRTFDRRELLQIGTVTGLAGLLGGLAIFTSPGLLIRNKSDQTHNITVRIQGVETGETILHKTYRSHPEEPDQQAKTLFPTPGEYNVCVTTDTGLFHCETWDITSKKMAYHITAATTENGAHYIAMGDLE